MMWQLKAKYQRKKTKDLDFIIHFSTNSFVKDREQIRSVFFLWTAEEFVFFQIFFFSTAGTVWEGEICLAYGLCGLIMVDFSWWEVDKLAFLRGDQCSLSPASNLRVSAEF